MLKHTGRQCQLNKGDDGPGPSLIKTLAFWPVNSDFVLINSDQRTLVRRTSSVFPLNKWGKKQLRLCGFIHRRFMDEALEMIR